MLDSHGLRPADVVSKRSKVYRERGGEIDEMTDEQLLAAMVDEPTLIRRPLVVAGETVVTGFDRAGLAAIAEHSKGNG